MAVTRRTPSNGSRMPDCEKGIAVASDVRADGGPWARQLQKGTRVIRPFPSGGLREPARAHYNEWRFPSRTACGPSCMLQYQFLVRRAVVARNQSAPATVFTQQRAGCTLSRSRNSAIQLDGNVPGSICIPPALDASAPTLSARALCAGRGVHLNRQGNELLHGEAYFVNHSPSSNATAHGEYKLAHVSGFREQGTEIRNRKTPT